MCRFKCKLGVQIIQNDSKLPLNLHFLKNIVKILKKIGNWKQGGSEFDQIPNCLKALYYKRD